MSATLEIMNGVRVDFRGRIHPYLPGGLPAHKGRIVHGKQEGQGKSGADALYFSALRLVTLLIWSTDKRLPWMDGRTYAGVDAKSHPSTVQ